MKQAAVIGSLNYDIFLMLAQIPRIGETANASSCKKSAGGKGANQAVQLAKLGVPTYMIGSIGDDHMGEVLQDSLKRAGVKTEYVSCIAGETTGMGVVDVLPDGSVMAVISHGANYRVGMESIRQAKKVLQEAELWVLQLEIPTETVIRTVELAKQLGKKVLLNAAPAAELPEETLRKCDYVVVNEVEAAFYTGCEIDSPEKAAELLPKITGRYGNCWVCTLGRHGAVIGRQGRTEFIPAIKTEVVETTGAGDSFVGGFSYGLLQGMDEFEAAAFAAHCSAITIRGVGAQESMPAREELAQEFGI